jgi:hypothetical protein
MVSARRSGEGWAGSSSENCTVRAEVGSARMVKAWMNSSGGCASRSSSISVRQVRRLRRGRGRMQRAPVPPSVHEPEVQLHARGAPSALLEVRAQRLEHAREQERERLQPVDRPFQLEGGRERLRGRRGDERAPRPLRARDGAAADPPRPGARPDPRAGSAPRSPSVASPQRRKRSRRSSPRSRRSSGSGASVAASCPGGMTVRPSRPAGGHERGHARGGQRDAHVAPPAPMGGGEQRGGQLARRRPDAGRDRGGRAALPRARGTGPAA